MCVEVVVFFATVVDMLETAILSPGPGKALFVTDSVDQAHESCVISNTWTGSAL